MDDVPLCWTLRNVSSICGCPIAEGGCNLCGGEVGGEQTVGNPNLEVPILLQEQFDGFIPTCELFEAYLFNVPGQSSTCTLAQDILEDYCGCSNVAVDNADSSRIPCSLCPNGENITLPKKLLGLEGLPLQTCAELDEATNLFLSEGQELCELMQSVSTYCGCPAPIENSCNLCKDGNPVPSPNATIEFLSDQFGFLPTCAIVQAQLDSVSADSSQCSDVQLLGSYCGCLELDNYCRACEEPPESFAEEDLPQFRDRFGFDMNCREAITLTFQLEADTEMCRLISDGSWLCGCNGGKFIYYGADNEFKKALLVWLPRLSAILSLMVRLTSLTS